MAGLPRLEQAAAGVFAQPHGEAVIADADAEIGLQRAEAEIEQDGSAIFFPRRLMIGADLRQRGALVHGAIISRQAKRDPLIPSGFGNAFRREGADSGIRFEGNAATRRHRRNGFRRLDEPRRLVRVARKFGDGAESAEVPLRIGIGYFPLQKINSCGGHCGLRNGSGSGMKKYSPRQCKGEYRLVRSGQAGPARGPNRLFGSERRAYLQQVGTSG